MSNLDLALIAILCGESSSFAIQSVPGEGTTVTIQMGRGL